MSIKRLIDIHNEQKHIWLGKVIFYQTGKFVQCFNEDAIILNRLLKYKCIVLGEEGNQYIKVSFPSMKLKNVMMQVKNTLKMHFVHIKKETEDELLNVVYYTNFKSSIKKSDLVKSNDVSFVIKEYNENAIAYKDFTINQIKRGAKQEYQLHIKIKKLFETIDKSILPFLPKKHKMLGDVILKNWYLLLDLVNKTRNKYDSSNKLLFHLEISSILDTMKDICDCIYDVKGFKNQQQYAFVYSLIVEIAKINSGFTK